MVSPSIEPGKDPGKAKITRTVPAKPGQLAAMPHTHKADTAERGTLAEQEGAQFDALIQRIMKLIVASICGVPTINVEEMCGCCE